MLVGAPRRLRKDAETSSFRGAGFARDPGIHEHPLQMSMGRPMFMGSGPGLKGRSGTAAEFFCNLLEARAVRNGKRGWLEAGDELAD